MFSISRNLLRQRYTCTQHQVCLPTRRLIRERWCLKQLLLSFVSTSTCQFLSESYKIYFCCKICTGLTFTAWLTLSLQMLHLKWQILKNTIKSRWFFFSRVTIPAWFFFLFNVHCHVGPQICIPETAINLVRISRGASVTLSLKHTWHVPTVAIN